MGEASIEAGAQSTHSLELAHAVLRWNQQHLNAGTTLTECLIGECFAEQFVVEPNGRRYEANRRLYREFLEGMKRTIRSIRYQVLHAIGAEASAALAMQVTITKVDGAFETFSAALLLRFDEVGKIVLWHEVYTPQEF